MTKQELEEKLEEVSQKYHELLDAYDDLNDTYGELEEEKIKIQNKLDNLEEKVQNSRNLYDEYYQRKNQIELMKLSDRPIDWEKEYWYLMDCLLEDLAK